MTTNLAASATQLPVAALGPLIDALRERGYQVVGPTVRGDAVVLAEIEAADELPHGWGVDVEAGSYRLRRRTDGAVFAQAAGPQSWKTFLHPPRERVWSAHRDGDDFTVEVDETPPPRYAFLGVRPCDLRAIAIQDRVLAGGDHADSRYARRRAGVFIVAINCTEPASTCFCVSAGGGPAAGPGYDLALTELIDDGGHRFLVDVGSEAGAEVLASLPHAAADEPTVAAARGAVADAADRMGRRLPEVDLRALLARSQDAAQWNDVASRCLTCGNCTMVCPTCFCTTAEDSTDLTGAHAERWRRWESCFDLDFSHLHGGNVRTSGASRYRQWLTHKLGTWHDQFGSSGCVGCGRCIVWCPVGIDITAEMAALDEESRR
jgi:ferredoxin